MESLRHEWKLRLLSDFDNFVDIIRQFNPNVRTTSAKTDQRVSRSSATVKHPRGPSYGLIVEHVRTDAHPDNHLTAPYYSSASLSLI